MEVVRTASQLIAKWALIGVFGGGAILLVDYGLQAIATPTPILDSSQVNTIRALAVISLGAGLIGFAIGGAKWLGWIKGTGIVELRYIDCIDCHHDYVHRSREDKTRVPGDVYRIEARNRTLADIRNVTVWCDSADPPVEGLRVQLQKMNDPSGHFSLHGVTVPRGGLDHWTTVVKKDAEEQAHIETTNDGRDLAVGQHYTLTFHAESDGIVIDRGDFEVYFVESVGDTLHLRFRRAAP